MWDSFRKKGDNRPDGDRIILESKSTEETSNVVPSNPPALVQDLQPPEDTLNPLDGIGNHDSVRTADLTLPLHRGSDSLREIFHSALHHASHLWFAKPRQSGWRKQWKPTGQPTG